MRPTIERYEILDVLGEGGMGVVYLARQRAPVDRTVALKVLSTQVESRVFTMRFLSEQRTLARLTHPHIAQFYDAGASEEGLPYFAMEHVRGRDVVEYANTEKLSVQDRLKLFFQVCSAVQFAHQKGVLHRDLKPSNILIQESTAGPQAKLIDFGIAKALGDVNPTDASLTGPLGIGTPAYMAPEAFDPQALLDTRSDVFSLAVVLQQLLLGSVPFKGESQLDIVKQIASRSILDAQTQWRGLDPDEQTRLLDERQLDASGMKTILKGDLGAIVSKGTAFSPADRYDSVSELALDLQAHLDGYPVKAQRLGASYRIGKFVRRHRAGVAMAATLLVTILVGGGIAAYEARIATLESARAKREAARANQEAAVASAVTEFMIDLFRLADPDESLGKRISAKEVLDRGADRLESELEEQPELRARMGLAMGQTYLGLGLFDDSGALLDRSLEWAEAASGETGELTGRVWTALGRQALYAHDTERAVEALERANSIFEAAPGRGSVDWAIAHAWLGFTHSYRGDDRTAVPMLSSAVEVLRNSERAPVSDRIFALSKHGVSMSVIGEYEDAYASLVRAQQLAENAPGGAGYMNLVLNGLTLHYSHAEKYDLALELARQAYEENVAQHGAEHPDVLNSWSLYIIFLLKTDQAELAFGEAKKLHRVATSLERSVDQVYALRHLAKAHLARGDVDAAWKWVNEALDQVLEALGEEHGVTRYVRVAWAEVASRRGQHDEALAVLRPLEERNLEQYGPKSRITRDTTKLIAECEARAKQPQAGK